MSLSTVMPATAGIQNDLRAHDAGGGWRRRESVGNRFGGDLPPTHRTLHRTWTPAFAGVTVWGRSQTPSWQAEEDRASGAVGLRPVSFRGTIGRPADRPVISDAGTAVAGLGRADGPDRDFVLPKDAGRRCLSPPSCRRRPASRMVSAHATLAEDGGVASLSDEARNCLVERLHPLHRTWTPAFAGVTVGGGGPCRDL